MDRREFFKRSAAPVVGAIVLKTTVLKAEPVKQGLEEQLAGLKGEVAIRLYIDQPSGKDLAMIWTVQCDIERNDDGTVDFWYRGPNLQFAPDYGCRVMRVEGEVIGVGKRFSIKADELEGRGGLHLKGPDIPGMTKGDTINFAWNNVPMVTIS